MFNPKNYLFLKAWQKKNLLKQLLLFTKGKTLLFFEFRLRKPLVKDIPVSKRFLNISTATTL